MAAKTHFCEPLSYEDAMKQQQEIIENETRAVTNYEYSYGKSGKQHSRVIVPEAEDRELVRVYSNSYKGYFFCSLCNRLNSKKRLRATFDGKIFMAPVLHECLPISLRQAQAESRKNKIIAYKKKKSSVERFSSNESIEGGDDDNETNFLEQSRHGKRCVTSENYKFYIGGIKHDKQGKIIVFEEDDQNLIREYRRDSGSHYYCCGCKRASSVRIRGVLKKDIFHIPLMHSNSCEPVAFEVFQKEQEEYEAKGPSHHHYPPQPLKPVEAAPPDLWWHKKRKVRRPKRSLPTTTTASKYARMIEDNHSPDNISPVNNESPNENSLNNEQDSVNDGNGENEGNNTNELQNTSVSTAAIDNNNLSISAEIASVFKNLIQEKYDTSETLATKPLSIKQQQKYDTAETLALQRRANPSTNVSFYHPSEYYLSQTCKKVNLQFTENAYEFCNKMKFKYILPTSFPSLIHPTTNNEYPGFNCFSLFLTGNESNSLGIREMTNKYIYKNFKALGHCLGHNFSEFNHFNPIIFDAVWSFSTTPIHFEMLSLWFECRIGIYENGRWTRYGDWDDANANIPTFLMESMNGKFHPILELKN
uniref:Uncharacterized protein n=1 Tax=Panagrolaimus sp. ES5 TaxID=591445 RepID=A0AC34FF83_9BILA